MNVREEARACKDAIHAYCEDRYYTYGAMGVRSVFYAMVGQGIVEKTLNDASRVGRFLTQMREAEEMPWHWIEDATRQMYGVKEGTGSAKIGSHRRRLCNAIAPTRAHGLWEGQENRVLIWIEKEGLSSLFQRAIYDVCPQGIEFVAGKGQASVTIKNHIAENIADEIASGWNYKIFYFGDFDDAGRKIWESGTGNALTAKLRRYVERHLGEPPDDALDMQWRAVTAEQISTYSLPTRPEKNRNSAYSTAVEMDSLPPDVMTTLVQDCIRESVDLNLIKEAHQRNQDEHDGLADLQTRVAEMCDELAAEGWDID